MEAECTVSLSVLAKEHNREWSAAMRHIIQRHDESQAEAFKALFNPLIPESGERGLVLLEPHDARPADPPIKVAGTTFKNQGERSAKRLRLVAASDNGEWVPASISMSDDKTANYTRTYTGNPFPGTPWMDLRLLAGSIRLGSPNLGRILTKLVNVATVTPSDPAAASIQLPVIIRGVRDLVGDDPADFPAIKMIGNIQRVIDAVNRKIDARLPEVTASSPMNTLLGWIRTQNDSDDVYRAVQTLARDPILFITGARYPEHLDDGQILEGIPHSAIVRAGVTINGNANTTTFFRVNIKQDGTAGDLNSEQMMEVLRILLVQPETTQWTVRLSQWREATGEMLDEMREDPKAITADSGTVSTVESPWLSQVIKPNIDRRFRLHVTEPRNAALDAVVSDHVEPADYDAAMKPFELDIHAGDYRTYTGEVLTSIRLALQMIIAKTADTQPADAAETADTQPADAAKVKIESFMQGDPDTLYNKPIPIIPSFRDSAVMSPVGPSLPYMDSGDGKGPSVSLCSRFLYNHVSIATQSPLHKASLPSHKELSAFLASLNPFPLVDPTDRAFINTITTELRDHFMTQFRTKAFHLVRLDKDSQRPVMTSQPYDPMLCNFQRVTSDTDKLVYCTGSELTPVIEGVMLAVHMMNAITNDAAPLENDVQAPTHTKVPLGMPDQAAKIRMAKVATGETTSVLDIDGKAYDASGYGDTLFKDTEYTLVGDYKLGKGVPDPTHGPTGFFNVQNVTINTTLDVTDGHTHGRTYSTRVDNPDGGSVGHLLYTFTEQRRFAVLGLYITNPAVIQFQTSTGVYPMRLKGNPDDVALSLDVIIPATFYAEYKRNLVKHISKPPKFTYKAYRTEKTSEQIVDLLKNGFKGLYYSNTRALQRTVFAVAVGKLYDSIDTFLRQPDTRWRGKSFAWAVDINTERSPTAVLLRTLFADHERGNERNIGRNQTVPLVELAQVRVHGPGPFAVTTTCSVREKGVYVYRTDRFQTIEVDMITQVRANATRPLVLPESRIGQCLADTIRTRPTSIDCADSILRARPKSAPAVARVMLLFNEIDKIRSHSSEARDHAVLKTVETTLNQAISHLLYNV